MGPFNAPVIIVTKGRLLDVYNNRAEYFLITFCKGLDGDQTSPKHEGVKYGTPKIHPLVTMMTRALKGPISGSGHHPTLSNARSWRKTVYTQKIRYSSNR